MDEAFYLDDLDRCLTYLRVRLNDHIKSLRSVKNYKTQDLGQAKALRDNLNRTINIIRTRPMTIDATTLSEAFSLEKACKDFLQIA